MSKLFSVLFSILIVSNSFSQLIESKIPATAECVIGVNGKIITDKIGVKTINNSALFMEFAQNGLFTGNSSKKISNIGIDYSKDLFFFYNNEDSLSYYAYFYEIQKPKLFGKYIAEKNEAGTIMKLDGYSILIYDGMRDFLVWNDEFAGYFILDNFNVDYREVAMYETEAPPAPDMAVESVEIEYTEEMDAATEAVEESSEAKCEEGKCDQGKCESAEPVVEKTYELKEIDNSTDEVEVTQESYEDIMKKRELERTKQADLEKAKKTEVILKVMKRYFSKSSNYKSIDKVSEYTEKQDEVADVNIWFNIDNVRSSRYSYYYGYRYGFYNYWASTLRQFAQGVISSQIYFNKNDIEWKTEMKYGNALTDLFAKVYSTKLPKSFTKYLTNMKPMAISSASLNSKSLWEAYPKLYASIFQNMDRSAAKYAEEINVAMDFVEIMLDESALGDLVTGDVVFVLNDLLPIQVEYQSYEYNSDYSGGKYITKTREEIVPQFLTMFGTKNAVFMEKLLKLACKHEVMYAKNGYYYSNGENRDFPFEMYFTIKDEIAFISTSKKDMESIIDGSVKQNFDKKLESNMLKNQGFAMVDFEQILIRLGKTEMRAEEKLMVDYAKVNTKKLYYKNNFVDGAVKNNMNLILPESAKNGAIYLWDFANEVHRIGKEN